MSAYHSSLDSRFRALYPEHELCSGGKAGRNLLCLQAATEESAAASEAQRQQVAARDEAAAEVRDRLAAARQQGADAAAALEDALAAAEHAEADATSKQVPGVGAADVDGPPRLGQTAVSRAGCRGAVLDASPQT